MNRCTALLLGIILSVAAVCVPGVAGAQTDENPNPPPYSGLFVPTADALSRITGATYLLPFPPILATQVGFSIQQIATINVMGGFLLAPWEDSYGVLSTASLKLHPLLPTPRRWGLAAQVQWMGGGAVSGQGDGFGVASNIIALELVASSPARSIRTHFGAAMHTMPGSEYMPFPGSITSRTCRPPCSFPPKHELISGYHCSRNLYGRRLMLTMDMTRRRISENSFGYAVFEVWKRLFGCLSDTPDYRCYLYVLTA